MAFLVDREYMSLDIIVYIVRFYGIDAPIGVIRRHSSFFRSRQIHRGCRVDEKP